MENNRIKFWQFKVPEPVNAVGGLSACTIEEAREKIKGIYHSDELPLGTEVVEKV